MDQEQMVSAVLQAVQALPQDRQPARLVRAGWPLRLRQDDAGSPAAAADRVQRGGCMDHFFLRPQQRTRERLQQPGGNAFDYERLHSPRCWSRCGRARTVPTAPTTASSRRLAEPVAVRQES